MRRRVPPAFFFYNGCQLCGIEFVAASMWIRINEEYVGIRNEGSDTYTRSERNARKAFGYELMQ